MSTRIPFAIHKETGELVEVGGVPRGRDCDCLCPSCNQSVVARHGDQNAWHFAHDPDAEHKPLKECDISFDSCCRQFAIDMAVCGLITTLQTPGLVLYEPGPGGLSVPVASERLFEDVRFHRGKRFDLVGTVSGKELFIHFSYPKRAPLDVSDVVGDGVLEIDIGVIQVQYYSHKSEPGLIGRLIKALVEGETKAKRWVQHPALERSRTELQRKIAEHKAAERKALDGAVRQLTRRALDVIKMPVCIRALLRTSHKFTVAIDRNHG